MSRIGDFVIECGEEYERRHPESTWNKTMDVILSDNNTSRSIQKIVLKRRRNGMSEG